MPPVTSSPPPVIITVDTKAPDAPIISSATDDVGSLQSDLTNGGRSDDTLPLLKGTGVADSTITIYDGATPIGTATVTPEGSWSFQVTQPLSEGPHALSAIATDKAGNASSAGNFTLTIDTTPPTAPVITSAEGLIGSETKLLANGGAPKATTPSCQAPASRVRQLPFLIMTSVWVRPPCSQTALDLYSNVAYRRSTQIHRHSDRRGWQHGDPVRRLYADGR